jgi:putative SOS response-associated peptidase YedK
MPVIISYNNISHWLDKQAIQEVTQQLLTSDGYEGMSLKQISDWINSLSHNDKNCLN